MKKQLPIPSEVQTHGLCEWNANGMRCCFPGVMSRGQLGGGPWYCGWHYRCEDGITGAQIVAQSHAWDGKPESYLAMRRATVYGKNPKATAPSPAREPGEDNEERAAE